MDNPQNKMQPVNMFSDMFKRHLKATDHNLVINNFVLLRNVLKEAVRNSFVNESSQSKINEVEEVWATLGKGCGCTRSKRLSSAIDSTIALITSPVGKVILREIKESYDLKTLVVDLPDSPVKFEI